MTTISIAASFWVFSLEKMMNKSVKPERVDNNE